MTKVCPECGRGFEPNPRVGMRQKFCSHKCGARAASRAQVQRVRAVKLALRSGRVCKRCGKTFTPKNSRGVYCSRKCQKAAMYERLRADHAAARGTRKCPVCGKEFTPKNIRCVYCSRACYNRIYKVGHCHKVEMADRKCECCGKVFTPNTSRARYCSLQCRRSVEHEKTKAAKLAARANRVCPVCGATFTPKSCKGIYCSRYCKSHARGRHILQPSVPLDIRLMEQHVREYLSLPDAERYQRRGTLTPAELKMAEKMWNQMHGLRTV